MFSRKKINKVCVERLDVWRKVLVENNSTPFALVSVGHNENQGDIHMCITEDVGISTVIEIMEGAVVELKKL